MIMRLVEILVSSLALLVFPLRVNLIKLKLLIVDIFLDIRV